MAPVPDSLRLYGAEGEADVLGAAGVGEGGGAGYLLERVGAPFEADSEARCTAAFECLAALHCCGLIHGDARLPNLLVMEGGALAWIDLNHAGALLEGGGHGAGGGPSRELVAYDAGVLARAVLRANLSEPLPEAVACVLRGYRHDDASSVVELASAVWRARGERGAG